MQRQTPDEPQKPLLTETRIRLEGVTAKRLIRLSERTSVSINRLANMAATEGISIVEKRFR